MIVHSKLKDYDVTIEKDSNFLKELVKMSNAEYVIDQKVYQLYQEYFTAIPEDRLFLVEATEENKVIDTTLQICEKMTDIPAKRNAVLVSVGGGIIQDLTGFVANILYRGIKWIFIPTTLLASCDSCIGGKTSLNYKKYKNLLGTFYPPDQLYIYPAFFKTLSKRDYESGLGEVIKFNLMLGESGLDKISTDMSKIVARDDETISRYVVSSLNFKKDFIEIDEFDRGERIKLNFAHTFGHAIEVLSQYEIPHGTAVAIGMIIANEISVQRNLLKASFAKRSEDILLQVINVDEHWLECPIEDILQIIRKDKKQTSEALTAVLMTNIPKDLRIVHDISPLEVETGFRHFIDLYRTNKAGEVNEED